MTNKVNRWLKKFIWCLPALVMLLGTMYFINLFNRMCLRDLDRQRQEKYQIMSVLSTIKTKESMYRILNTLDSFRDTYTYLLDKDLKHITEEYHSRKCPFRFTVHPYEDPEIIKKLTSKKRGTFVYGKIGSRKIGWEFRWITVKDTKYLIITGVVNYPLDTVDKEFQISIGIFLLITALLNWALVGYAKSITSGFCKIR